MGLIYVSNLTIQCYSNDDGQKLYSYLVNKMSKDEIVTLSFKSIDSATSSFINSAFIQLLDSFDFKFIKSHLSIVESTKQINNIINDRFKFEVEKRKNLVSIW